MKHYLNNAGAALMSEATLAAIQDHLELEYRVGGYQAANDRKTEVVDFYRLASELLAAPSPGSIAFTDNASRAWNLALYGMPIKAGDTIVTLSSEFGTNLVSLFHFASKVGAHVEVIPCDPAGKFDLHRLEQALQNGGRLVALSHVAAHGSIVNPVEEIGRVVASYEALYLVDGCQSVGQVDIDVTKIGCHAYTGTGRKWLRGPRGTAFLYVRPDAPIEPIYVDLASADLAFQDGKPTGVTIRQDARRFELWERSIAGLLGLRQALREYMDLDKETAFEQMRLKATALRRCISQRNGLNLLGEVDSPSSIVGFYLADPDSESRLLDKFKSAEIAVSTMSDWDCPMHFPRTGVGSIIRLAPHYFTPQEAVDEAIRVIQDFEASSRVPLNVS